MEVRIKHQDHLKMFLGINDKYMFVNGIISSVPGHSATVLCISMSLECNSGTDPVLKCFSLVGPMFAAKFPYPLPTVSLAVY